MKQGGPVEGLGGGSGVYGGVRAAPRRSRGLCRGGGGS
jgi:hypothetical protein